MSRTKTNRHAKRTPSDSTTARSTTATAPAISPEVGPTKPDEQPFYPDDWVGLNVGYPVQTPADLLRFFEEVLDSNYTLDNLNLAIHNGYCVVRQLMRRGVLPTAPPMAGYPFLCVRPAVAFITDRILWLYDLLRPKQTGDTETRDSEPIVGAGACQEAQLLTVRRADLEAEVESLKTDDQKKLMREMVYRHSLGDLRSEGQLVADTGIAEPKSMLKRIGAKSPLLGRIIRFPGEDGRGFGLHFVYADDA